MPGAKGAKGRVKRGAAPAWADGFTELCLPPPKPKPRRPKAKKRFHRAFRVLIALGLVPTKSRQCDPLGLRLNRMHVMDSDCEKTGGCLAAESAPDLIKSSPGDEASHESLRDAKTPTEEVSTVVPMNGNHSADEEEKKDENEKVEETSAEEETKGEDESPQGCAEEETKEDLKEEKEEEVPEEVKEEKVDEKPKEEIEDVVPEESPPPSKEAPVNMVVESEDTLKVNSEVSPKIEKREVVTEEKEEPVPPSEEDDRHSITSSHQSQGDVESRKRRGPKEGEADMSSGSESDSGRKKIKVEPDTEPMLPLDLHRDQTNPLDEGREKVIQDFVNEFRTVDDVNLASDKLKKELVSLEELARAKESEWNTILRVKKLKEEMLERINRKKRVFLLDDNMIDRGTDPQNQLMMVPIVSSSPSNVSGRNVSSWKYDNYSKPHQRQILPKPPYNQTMDPNNIVREGRNGPIKDVQSIIADFNQFSRSTARNEAPKRFRRGRSDAQQNRMTNNPALISMANMALGSGASVRTLDPYSPHVQDNSRSPSGDPSRVSDGQGGVGFKDVLVQFAKMSQSPGKGHAPPPPYPEVTLHPVTGHQSPPPTTTSSLLHGILTKPTNNPPQRPANFSPTLARLLVAPERPIRHTAPPPPPPPYSRSQPSNQVSLTDILTSSKKSRNEITITPVSGHPNNIKNKEDVVLLERYLSSTTRAKAYNSIPENILFKALQDDDDETGSGDRLVIDEGAEGEEVPQCQGCRQKSAQFVCAGCGNQWYCSRECQVAAWEEHSEMCSE